MRRTRKGHIFIVSAPSGAGKTTLCRAVTAHFKELQYSVSFTTRAPREGEQDGVDYNFISKEEFNRLLSENKWAEWARVHDNFYGTSSEVLKDAIKSGKDILLDIDVQGAMQIVKHFPESVTIFIMPPSHDALRERLVSRDADSMDVIEKRLKEAISEISWKDKYCHIIVNDDLIQAKSEIISLFESYINDRRNS
ncbi:MAG: guanylate kinase [Desulfobacterales bacterium]|nr:guanylate kinase [Desulfobacterales bacterium]